MHRCFLILCFFFACLPGICANEQLTTEQLLAQLDSVISNRDQYLDVKLAHLEKLNQDLISEAKDNRERFEVLGILFNEYHSFNADSAYAMAQRQLSLARQLGDKNMIINAM